MADASGKMTGVVNQLSQMIPVLEAHAGRLRAVGLRALFDGDPERFERFSFRLDDLLIDFSKELIDREALAVLLELADKAGVAAARDAVVAGEHWNLTEDRAVGHMALRGGMPPPDGEDVEGALARMLGFAEDVRSGRAAGSGGAFTDVVNIGIGGSDLGPSMAVRALSPDCDGPAVHFVSNIDRADLDDTLRRLDPARTLVVVASKTFTTLETMTNARSARRWLADALGDGASRHMAAVTSNIAAAAAMGIDASRVFGFRDWVGGRFSVWSSIGLPLAITIGESGFRTFLAGAASMDRHFRDAPLEQNLPVLFALIGIWRRNAMGCPTVALIPYDNRLSRFPAHVQQLDMESNGKQVTRDGAAAGTATGPVIWGEPGVNAQHSFFQMLHQGADIIPVDFITAAESRDGNDEHHAALIANCLAQGQALAFGRTEAEARARMAAEGLDEAAINRLAPHRTFPGNRPSTTILHRRLDPFSLGRLIALYEHKVFVQGVIWNINSFDQWGVELGKELAGNLIPALSGGATPEADASTAGLIRALKELGA